MVSPWDCAEGDTKQTQTGSLFRPHLKALLHHVYWLCCQAERFATGSVNLAERRTHKWIKPVCFSTHLHSVSAPFSQVKL